MRERARGSRHSTGWSSTSATSGLALCGAPCMFYVETCVTVPYCNLCHSLIGGGPEMYRPARSRSPFVLAAPAFRTVVAKFVCSFSAPACRRFA
jgi:hypothetical protein